MVIATVIIGLIVYFVTYGKYLQCLAFQLHGITLPLLGKIGTLRMGEGKESDKFIWQRKFLMVNNIYCSLCSLMIYGLGHSGPRDLVCSFQNSW